MFTVTAKYHNRTTSQCFDTIDHAVSIWIMKLQEREAFHVSLEYEAPTPAVRLIVSLRDA